VQGYRVEISALRIGSSDYRIRALSDRQQYWDPDGLAERAGISSASWPLFGMVWPAGVALAETMSSLAIDGRSVLEVGCGLGLSSLVLKRRSVNITASDHHPLAGEFLRHNSDLNDLPPITYQSAAWAGPNPALGRFDVIIGSDLLYERDHPALLTEFLSHHANPSAQVILADPGRARCGQFGARMAAQGYTRSEPWKRFTSLGKALGGRILNFVRAV
jgi:predicted nicotinamide N-methyase